MTYTQRVRARVKGRGFGQGYIRDTDQTQAGQALHQGAEVLSHSLYLPIVYNMSGLQLD